MNPSLIDRSYWYDKSIYSVLTLLLVLLVVLVAPVAAQDGSAADAGETAMEEAEPETMDGDEPVADDQAGGDQAADDEDGMSFFARTTVTATGTEIDTFRVATPTIVIDREQIVREIPNNAADLMRNQPGVDINGIGPNQGRPTIRGQRGHRVLFLEDGLRLNNVRRQTDFGEITGLVDIETVESVEVVRGAASVLWGSGAIGGVLNVVTKVPPFGAGSRFGGGLTLRYSDNDE